MLSNNVLEHDVYRLYKLYKLVNLIACRYYVTDIVTPMA